jgi:hypothetical protein
MKKIKLQLILFIIGSIGLFYLVPSIVPLILSSEKGFAFAILTLMIINPIYIFLSGYIFTKHNGFKWYFPLIIGVIFIPSILMLYNSSATVYTIVYSVLSYLGSLISIVTMKLKDN